MDLNHLNTFPEFLPEVSVSSTLMFTDRRLVLRAVMIHITPPTHSAEHQTQAKGF